MEQLIQAFGIDVKLITVQIVNFLILLGVLSYFLYKPVLNLLEKREEDIKQGIKDAEAAATAKAEAESEKQSVLSEAHKEAEAINERAKEHAGQKAVEITEAANEKSALIIKNAEAKGEEIKQSAHQESESEIAKLAVLAAEQVLREKNS